ncbi:hypothetical protein PV10_08745 [Exophiala mesophila]|uniref:Small ribosomal subunit protein uS4m n=1 Tax=Exophiala mesophila TaxID=212818 RepID=A0A0D1ZQU9_EXOME|nr:uncharacterized protein PV10_08745 [Exophiala mesophila]KIV89153.1 hypothetical protein PV10_08745 [Exophiala mesophila]
MARGGSFTPLKVNPARLNMIKIRQSWSKYNLYNLSRAKGQDNRARTFFALKWKAKSVSRNYHGSQVREGDWTRMFDRRLRSVIPMDAKYLATNDGSIESAGRGMGAELRRPKKSTPAIPYMQMIYAPLERRLDTAVFRAMFASSIRQARQFVIHGAVTVNGKKMKFPGYLLNPGDLFQVNSDRVMYAAGQPKENPAKVKAEKQVAEEAEAEAEAQAEAAAKEREEAIQSMVEKDEEEIAIDRDPRQVLKQLQAQARTILSDSRADVGGKRKQDLRAFTRTIRQLLSQSKKGDSIHSASLETQFAEIQEQLRIRQENKQRKSASESDGSSQKSNDTDAEISQSKSLGVSEQADDNTVTILSSSEVSELYTAIKSMHENPIDDSKPYATPWMPRDFMSAFAFIPRFLEVNHNICAAVYLRHPVAKPGMAEVPSPYSEDTSTIAFSWYLRRR